MKNSRNLYLQRKNMDDRITVSTIATYQTQNIEKMFLANNRITPIAIKMLSQWRWNNLASLGLSYNFIGNKGCKFLSHVDLPKIKIIIMKENCIENTGFLHLSKTKWAIEQICLEGNHLSGESFSLLTRCDWNQIFGVQMSCMSVKTPICLIFTLLLWESKQIRNIRLGNTLDKTAITRMKIMGRKKASTMNVGF